MNLSEVLNRKQSNLQIVPIKVTEIGTHLIDGQPLDGSAEILDAFTKAQTDNDTGITIKPTNGSTVYVLMTTPPLALLYDQLDQYAINIDTAKIQIDKDGILLQKGNQTLNSVLSDTKAVLDDLVSLLETFKVICSPPGTPSTLVEPSSLVKIQSLKPKINLLKNNIDTLLKQ